ncbi:MAG: hypothetical protein JO173_09255 [Gammaproteobacteria bacterium]|nr:hypothetical protein [Gammaproteobacteria bacterium]
MTVVRKVHTGLERKIIHGSEHAPIGCTAERDGLHGGDLALDRRVRKGEHLEKHAD